MKIGTIIKPSMNNAEPKDNRYEIYQIGMGRVFCENTKTKETIELSTEELKFYYEKVNEICSNMENDKLTCGKCKWCTWACPGYMCMNEMHPDFEKDSDYPVTIYLKQNACDLFECIAD